MRRACANSVNLEPQLPSLAFLGNQLLRPYLHCHPPVAAS